MNREKRESKVDELVEKYKQYEKQLKNCLEEQQKKHDELVAVEEKIIVSGDKTLQKKRDKLRADAMDLKFHEEALRGLMQKTRGRIVEAIPEEVQGHLETVNRELEMLRAREEKKKQEFAKALAKAVSIFEEFHGREITITMDGRLRATYPRVRIGTFAIHGEIQSTYFKELNKIREGQSETLYEKRKKVNKERTRLLKALEREPRELVNEILGVRRPAGGSEDKSPREPRFRAGKLTYSNSEAFKPEYRDSEVPRVDHKSARMYSDK